MPPFLDPCFGFQRDLYNVEMKEKIVLKNVTRRLLPLPQLFSQCVTSASGIKCTGADLCQEY